MLTNDTAPNGTYAVVSFTQPTNGTVVETSPGVLQYTPDPGFYGYETFTYTVNWDVVTPAVPATPATTGGTEFEGRDATFVWNDIFTAAEGEANASAVPYLLKYYEINILDSVTDAIIRTEVVNESRYTYSYDKNASDAVGTGANARREFTFSVRAIGRQNQTSAPAELTVSNPAPVRVGDPVINNATITLPLPNDRDFSGYRIWYKSTDDINPLTDPYRRCSGIPSLCAI